MKFWGNIFYFDSLIHTPKPVSKHGVRHIMTHFDLRRKIGFDHTTMRVNSGYCAIMLQRADSIPDISGDIADFISFPDGVIFDQSTGIHVILNTWSKLLLATYHVNPPMERKYIES
jgi:hypothetical protein